MSGTAPWFVVPLLALAGLILIALGVPLARRRVKPNAVYGLRVPATLADEGVWYEMNARAGRHMIVIACVYLLLVAALALTRGHELRFLAPMGFLASALMIDALVLTAAANRMLRERRRPGDRGS